MKSSRIWNASVVTFRQLSDAQEVFGYRLFSFVLDFLRSFHLEDNTMVVVVEKPLSHHQTSRLVDGREPCESLELRKLQNDFAFYTQNVNFFDFQTRFVRIDQVLGKFIYRETFKMDDSIHFQGFRNLLTIHQMFIFHERIDEINVLFPEGIWVGNVSVRKIKKWINMWSNSLRDVVYD